MRSSIVRVLGVLPLLIGVPLWGQAQEKNKIFDTLTYDQQAGLPAAASKIYFSDSRFTLSGFYESNYTHYTGPKNRLSNDIELYNTHLNRFVMYAAYKPTKKVVLYAEVFAELLHDGGLEHDFEFQPEVFADFLFSPQFNMRLGSHQVQIGYVNNNDEPILFYSVNRPELERLIIPSTWIDLGVMTYGMLNQDLKWSASVYQGLDPTQMNGSSWIRQGRSEVTRFEFSGATLNGSLKYTGIPHTELAITGLYSHIGAHNVRSDLFLVSPYVRYNQGRFSAMALAASGGVSNTEQIRNSTSLTTENIDPILGSRVGGYYIELGYDLFPFFKSKKPRRDGFWYRSSEIKVPVFARFEQLNTHRQVRSQVMPDSYIPQSNLMALTTGFNIVPRKNIVIKCNYQFRDNRVLLPNGEREGNTLELGLGVLF